MSQIKALEIFTPGAFPLHTYVERQEHGLESKLSDGLDTPGQLVSLSGPSKSGKTVLVERVVGIENLITVTGAGIEHPDEVWNRVLDWLDLPEESTTATVFGGKATIGAEAKGKAGVPFVVEGEAGGRVEAELSGERSKERVYRRHGLGQIVNLLAGSGMVILLDDFHYMPRAVQDEVAKQIKEAIRLGLNIVTASVPHRSDDVVRANPELRGRVLAVDLHYWNPIELYAIAEKGFRLLNVGMTSETINSFATEAAGSPQLMQAICLNACLDLEFREPQASLVNYSLAPPERSSIFERTASTTNFRSLVDVLDGGPRTRGTERKTYDFSDMTEGDVYRCILKAIASDPPKLSFSYDEIVRRVNDICMTEPPVGSSIVGSCVQIAKLASEKFPKERVIDWDETKNVLDIPDPYLLFYLRWSGRLIEPEV